MKPRTDVEVWGLADPYAAGPIGPEDWPYADQYAELLVKLEDYDALRARVAALEAIERTARELVNEGMRNNGYALCVIEKPDKSDPHYRLCTLLERASESAGDVHVHD